MTIGGLTVIILAAGACGGILNAFLYGTGLALPKTEDGVFQPGFIGNVVLGLAAAGIFWGLYGPYAAVAIVGGTASPATTSLELTLSSLVGAFLIGIAGAKWLSSEVDNLLQKKVSYKATLIQPNPQIAAKIASSKPKDSLKIPEIAAIK
jgi:hypothetical protein